MNKSTSLLQRFYKLSYLTACNNSTKPIKYYGFEYYPRHKDFKDPPYQPAKLFLIKRIKSVKGTNPVERRNLGYLNIDGPIRDQAHINIVKNIPQINALLWTVKHLVKITPIHWKGELPTNGDFSGTYLRETGEFIISPKLKVSEGVLAKSEEYINDKKKFSHDYLKSHLRNKWMSGWSGIE